MGSADINITNNECKYMGWISDRIFIWHTQGSGGLVTEYSFGVCMDPVDCWLNIHSVYAGVRWITNEIFSWCMQGSSRFPTEYSFSVYMVQADYRRNTQLVYARSGGLLTEYSFGVCRGPVDFRLNIQLVCAGIRRITDQIFIWCMHKQITNWIALEFNI